MPQARSLDEREPLTPCVKVCRLDASGFCVGCKRSVEEIMHWGAMSRDERLHLMREELPKRWTD
ncbi:hypothetical protein HNQ86_001061 [Oleiagrimonas soli]|nr:hypothetical protein [Oleiagrimonas soli]